MVSQAFKFSGSGSVVPGSLQEGPSESFKIFQRSPRTPFRLVPSVGVWSARPSSQALKPVREAGKGACVETAGGVRPVFCFCYAHLYPLCTPCAACFVQLSSRIVQTFNGKSGPSRAARRTPCAAALLSISEASAPQRPAGSGVYRGFPGEYPGTCLRRAL